MGGALDHVHRSETRVIDTNKQLSWKIAIGAGLTIVVAGLTAKSWWRDLRPDAKRPVDFFQDWASARFYFEGRSLYDQQAPAMKRYLGLEVKRASTRQPFIDVNAHPPTSLFLYLPFSELNYPNAALAWNLISLLAMAWSIRIVVKELDIQFAPWMLLYLIPGLLLCGPLREQVGQGQLNLVLLLLLVGTWAMARNGHGVGAGVLLGTATAIKLFPGFLFLYFLMRRQWRLLTIGAITIAAWTGAALLVFGWSEVQAFVREALPGSRQFREFLMNQSLRSFWHKLFDGSSGHVHPLLHRPSLAVAATLISWAAVIVMVAWASRRATAQQAQDHAFSLAILGMLLVSPLVWSHYYVMLLLPGLLLWRDLPQRGAARMLFLIAVVALWISLLRWWGSFLGISAGNLLSFVAQPRHVLTIVHVHLYAVLMLFGLQCWLSSRTSPGNEHA